MGCRSLVLASRSAALPREALEEFARQGVAVFVVRADCGNAMAMAMVLDWSRQQLPAVMHCAHAAGVTGQTLLKVCSSPVGVPSLATSSVRHADDVEAFATQHVLYIH